MLVTIGCGVRRTGKPLTMTLQTSVIGRVINPLGRPIDV